ncbi:unnamed protein product [Trifolium pratense]|uniref:Uncharacterized protein n=1 Tax=Trifolium pratense TaxID=57577 RepID=A0ACB0ISG4_TRIPR|nr:unnamed protein product [Trifolium pratense]
MIFRFFDSFFLLFLLFFIRFASLQAFTGTYGINYGRLADNIPSPDEVVTLLRAAKIRNVRIYDADHSVLKAFSGTGLEIVIGVTNGQLQDMSSNADHALNWVKDNVQAFLPETRIRGIAIGNEVLGGSNTALYGVLLDAAKNIYNATKKLHIDKLIQITTSNSYAVFQDSYPPSSCKFNVNFIQYIKPLLEFFQQIGSPFCLNAYPSLTYMGNPKDIDINYALFQPNKGIDDPKFKLHYDNLLDAQIDAAYAALEDAGFHKMEIIITETGWASAGDQNETGANVTNARTYNYNLRKRLAKKKGTPHRPKNVLKAYIFAIFNENSKDGPTSERNYGLFKADGSISYNIGFHGLNAGGSSHLSIKDINTHGLSRSYTITLILCLSALILMIF